MPTTTTAEVAIKLFMVTTPRRRRTDSDHAKCARCIYQRRCTRRRSVKVSRVKWRYRVPAVDVCWFDQRCLDVKTRTRFVHIRQTRRPSTTAPVSKPWTSYRLSATVGVSIVVFSSVCWLQLAAWFTVKSFACSEVASYWAEMYQILCLQVRVQVQEPWFHCKYIIMKYAIADVGKDWSFSYRVQLE